MPEQLTPRKEAFQEKPFSPSTLEFSGRDFLPLENPFVRPYQNVRPAYSPATRVILNNLSFPALMQTRHR
jgi:hypothetical protein